MSVRFRKSIKVGKGVRLNIGKRSVGVSVGGKYGGMSFNSKSGARVRSSLPGTGISYSTKIGKSSKRSRKASNKTRTATTKMQVKQKNKWVDLFLCVFFGYVGAHKFYEGNTKAGLLYLFTVGLFGIGWIKDIVILARECGISTAPETLEVFSETFEPDDELFYADGLNGHEFERWCANLLKRNGFSNVEVTPGSGDQGVDVLAEKDGVKYAVQCKCYSSDLGNTPVQEVNTGKSIYHCHVGAVMTNRYFTSGAKEAAAATGVLLWGRDKLSEMLKNCESSNLRC